MDGVGASGGGFEVTRSGSGSRFAWLIGAIGLSSGFAPSHSHAALKSRPWISCTKLITSWLAPHAKQWQNCFDGTTQKEGS